MVTFIIVKVIIIKVIIVKVIIIKVIIVKVIYVFNFEYFTNRFMLIILIIREILLKKIDLN